MSIKKEYPNWGKSWSVVKDKKIKKVVEVSLYLWSKKMYGTRSSIIRHPIEQIIWIRYLIISVKLLTNQWSIKTVLLTTIDKQLDKLNSLWIPQCLDKSSNSSNIAWTTKVSSRTPSKIRRSIKVVSSNRSLMLMSKGSEVDSFKIAVANRMDGLSIRFTRNTWTQI